MEVFYLTITQGTNQVLLVFNQRADAIEFADTVLECADTGTEVTILGKEAE